MNKREHKELVQFVHKKMPDSLYIYNNIGHFANGTYPWIHWSLRTWLHICAMEPRGAAGNNIRDTNEMMCVVIGVRKKQN